MKYNYYDKTYYDWQKKAGVYGGMQDAWKFEHFIKPSDAVLDFGCGGGFLLENIKCKIKYGVDINMTARREAEEKGIRVFSSLDTIPFRQKFDAIISHHTLEHIEDPASVLKTLRKYLKKNGLSIHVVPIDDWRNEKKYNPKDVNKHLYTWTPLLIGNLFAHCGYLVQDTTIVAYQWLPLSRYYYKYIPKYLYYFLCKIWGALIRNREIRIIARPK